LPSHVDLSVLWVPIMPETSKLGPAMEEAGKDATESFGKATSGIGDKIHDSFTKATGKVRDVFHKAGNDASESMAEGVKQGSKKVEDAVAESGEKAKGKFREKLGDLSKQVLSNVDADAVGRTIGEKISTGFKDTFQSTLYQKVSDAFGSDKGWIGGKIAEQIGDSLGSSAGQGITTWLKDLKGDVNGVKDAANTTKQAFASFKDGDTVGGVSKLVDSFGKLGIEVKDLPQPLQDVLGKTNAAKASAQEFADVFKGMPGIVGKLGTAISELAGPLGLVIGLSTELYQEQHAANDAMRQAFQDPGLRAAMEHRESAQHPFTPAAPDKPLPPMDMTTKTAEAQLAASGDKEALRDLQLRAQQGDQEAATLLHDNNLASAIPAAPTAPSTGSWFGGPGRGHGPIPSARSSYTAPADLVPRDAGGASGLNLSTIPIAAQKYANDCIDASARIILSHSGINMTEDQMMGVIPAGGTIDSQAAGMNKLDPAGGFKAMPGSGGSPAAMFAAIKASIDSGTGSVLNVAPGSSLAGRNFSEGHFIAATGYNPDGTINLSDTARGTKYSVSQADAFQATRGRGIVAGTGAGFAGTGAGPVPDSSLGGGGRGSLGSSGGIGIPTGAQHDPLYIMPADAGGSGGSSSQDQGQQLGSGLIDGLMQAVGLDGSVLKGFGGSSNPLHFGITKLATGLVNSFAGGGQGGGGGSLGGGSILPGLGSLIPHAASGGVPIGPGGAQNVRTGDTTNHYYGDTGPQLNVQQYGVSSPTQDLQATANGAGNRLSAMGGANNSGTLPATGTG
jgi:hypothetical protein